jgi:ankyrin repeat protein
LENKSNSLTTSNVSTSNNTTVKDTTSNDADNRNAISLQHRDHVGRTALHLAILVQDTEIAKLLIDEGCRMIARMVDGRTALHMAAQYGLDEVINKMYEKSRENKGEVERKERESGKLKDDSADEDEEMKDGTTPPPETTTTETEPGRPSSEDDWSSDENDGKDADASMDVDDEEGDNSDDGEDEEEYDDCEDEDSSDPAKKKKQQEDQPPPNPEDEDNVEEPDILDIDAGDWDQGFTPLCYAVFYSPTPSTVSILLSHGADPNKATSPSNGNTWATTRSIPPLYLSLVRSSSSADHDEDLTISIAERLIDAGATISTASDDDGLMTVLHYAVVAQKPRLLDLFLRKDKNGARAALDFPSVTYAQSRFPVASAIARGAYASLLTLLAHGGKVNPGGSDILRAKAIRFVLSFSRR